MLSNCILNFQKFITYGSEQIFITVQGLFGEATISFSEVGTGYPNILYLINRLI